LIVASAIFSTICEIGYFIGYICMGTKMSPYNYFGISLILVGILFLHIE
jgi:multidrug transporter EmrE-like cation transporter